MIQWWKREELVDDRNCLVGCFFPRILPMAISVKWKMVMQIPPQRWQVGEKNNISKKKHYPTVNAEDITVGAYCLLWIDFFKFYTSLFGQIFFLVYPFTLFFLYGMVGLFVVLKVLLSLITIVSLTCAFMYFILFFT